MNLFPNENGVQLTENGLRCIILKYNKRHGVEKTNMHLFRHTAATNMHQLTGDFYTVGEILEHKALVCRWVSLPTLKR